MNDSGIRFPEAQSNPHGLPAVERAIAVIQSSRKFNLPHATTLPTTGTPGQTIETDDGVFIWSNGAWTAVGGGNDFFNY